MSDSMEQSLSELRSRVEKLEWRLASLSCGCGKSSDTSPKRFRRGTEIASEMGAEKILGVRTAHWDRDDAGDCESTFVDLSFYDDGKWTIFQRTHDNGTFAGDNMTIYIQLFVNNVEVERLYICDGQGFGPGDTDDAERSGYSDSIRRNYVTIDKANRHIECN